MASIACIPSVPAARDAAALRDRARGALLGLAVGDALGAPAENMKPSEIRARWGRITGYVGRAPGRHGRHGVRDLLRAAARPARLGAHPGPCGGGLAPVDRRPRRGPLPRRRFQRTRHPGEPAPGPGRPHLRPAPARLERRSGDARGTVRRLRGGPPGRGGPAGRDRRLGEPRRRGHLRRPGGRGGRGGGDGGRADHRRGRLRAGGRPRRLLDGTLPAPGGGGRPTAANARSAPRW